MLRNGFVGHVAHQSGKVFHEVEDDGLLAPVKVNSTSSTSDELKHLLVVNVIRHNTHIVEQLMVSVGKFSCDKRSLPECLLDFS